MTNTRHRLALGTALGLLMSCGLVPALGVPTALAQDSGEATSLAPISVDDSARNDAPAGTSGTETVDAEELARKQPASVADAVSDIAGVSVARAADLLTSNITIRNFGGNSAMPDSQHVVYALDGISTAGGNFYRNSAGQVVDPVLLKSIDVLKGPLASLEYGSGIVGGTIAMETINAADLTGDTPGVKMRQVLGANSNGDGWKTSSTLAWQPDENFDFLANYARSYSKNKKDGHGDTIDLGGYNVPSYLLKGRYRFGANRDHSLTFTYDKSESVQQNVPFATSSILTIFGNVNRDRKGDVATLSYGWNPQDNPLIDLQVQLSRSKQDYHIEGLSAISSMFAGDYTVDTDTFSVKNTTEFATGSVQHRLRAGLELSHQDHDGIMSGVAGAGSYDRRALFAMDNMDLGNALTLSAGARIEHQALSDLLSSSGADLPDMDATARSAGLGLEKGLAGGFAAYTSFTYSEGLTLPEFAGSTWATQSGYWGDNVSKSRTWELGTKYRGDNLFAAGDSLSAKIGLFQTDLWDNNAYPSTAYEILSSAGLEAQLAYAMANGIYARTAITTTFDNRYRNGSGSDWSAYEYALTDQARVTLGRTFGNGMDLSWTLRAGRAQDLNDLHQAGWGVNDIAFSYTFASGLLSGVRADLGVDNIFDKQYVMQYTTSSASYPEAGRDIRFTLSKTF